MQMRAAPPKLLLGLLILLFGGAVGCALLLEKNGNHAIFGTGTSIPVAIAAGMAIMAPGAGLILRHLGPWPAHPSDARALPRGAVSALYALLALSVMAVLFFVYLCFGMTPSLPVGQVFKSVVSKDIAQPLKDYFHEGEIVASLGFFAAEGPRDFPMLIHGAGRNLLPAWIVSHFGGAETQIAEMRFITAAGNFLGVLLATAGATAAAYVIATRQTLVALKPVEAFAYSAFSVLMTMTLVATVGRITNREIVLFAVILVSVLLIWSAASERRRLARGLAFLLGAVTMLSPLHTYLGSVQSVMVATVAAAITLVAFPEQRPALFIRGILGALSAFVIVLLLGGYWLFHDAVSAILYWSENAQEIWGRFALRSVLVGSVIFMCAGAVLGGVFLSGKAVGMGDRAVRGVLLLLAALIPVSAYSYANLSDFNHFAFGLYIASPSIAGIVMLLLLSARRTTAKRAVIIALVLAVPAAGRLLTIDGSGIAESLRLLETPDDEILLPDALDFAARYAPALKEQDCLLILSNDGALAYLPRLPLCGPTFNPIHLNAEGDLLLAEWLEDNPQNLVVDGIEGHGGVGGPQMRTRLPRTFEVVDRLYPRTEQLGLWIIRLP